MKYSILYNLKPADRIVEPLFQTGLSKHHAIFLGEDSKGKEWIAENDFVEGVRILPAADYFKTARNIDRIEKFSGNQFERKYALLRAKQLVGKPYNLFTYNCEHYANEVIYGRSESLQVRTFFSVAIGILLIGLATSDN